MRGFTIVHEHHLSDLPANKLNSRLLKRISEAHVELPGEVSSVRGQNESVLTGVTLWRDAVDDSMRMSRTLFVSKREPYDREFDKKFANLSRQARHVGHVYHVRFDPSGDVLVGVGLHKPANRDMASHSAHYEEIRKIISGMDEHDIPLVHYLFYPERSDKALLIAKLAKPLFVGTGGEDSSSQYQKVVGLFRSKLDGFLKDILGHNSYRVYSAHIL